MILMHYPPCETVAEPSLWRRVLERLHLSRTPGRPCGQPAVWTLSYRCDCPRIQTEPICYQCKIQSIDSGIGLDCTDCKTELSVVSVVEHEPQR